MKSPKYIHFFSIVSTLYQIRQPSLLKGHVPVMCVVSLPLKVPFRFARHHGVTNAFVVVDIVYCGLACENPYVYNILAPVLWRM